MCGARGGGSQSPSLSFQAADPAQVGYGLAADSGLLGLLTLPGVLGAMLGALCADRLGRRRGARTVPASGFVPRDLCRTRRRRSVRRVHRVRRLQRRARPQPAAGPADRTGIDTGVYNTPKTLVGAAAGAALLDAVIRRPGVPAEGAYFAFRARAVASSGIVQIVHLGRELTRQQRRHEIGDHQGVYAS
jgi:hypothetical protein